MGWYGRRRRRGIGSCDVCSMYEWCVWLGAVSQIWGGGGGS